MVTPAKFIFEMAPHDPDRQPGGYQPESRYIFQILDADGTPIHVDHLGATDGFQLVCDVAEATGDLGPLGRGGF